ncbi:MAG TPA: HD domain-containing protein [Planctomycetota bacterium]|nr:HD domain-containing protein [Planctomycetota bacterium]
MKPLSILASHYDPSSDLYSVLLIHSVLVTRKARDIAAEHIERHPDTSIDLDFLTEASLLHDIGIKFCLAPEIHCEGPEPYVRHGILGRALLLKEGYPRHALVCARHTGAGITREEIREQRLPLPDEDLLPVSLEEKIICVADKFYSKKPRKLWKEKSLKSIRKGLLEKGERSLERWDALWSEILQA